MKKLISGGTLTLALLLAGCGDSETTNNAASPAAGSEPLPQVEAPNGDWTEVVEQTPEGGFRMGNPNAPVKLVEYGSLTCPACRAFSEQGTEPLRDNYIRSGQVSWEFRHLLIHGAPDLVLAMLANCQRPEAFFRTIEQLYDQQNEILSALDPQEQQQLQALPPQQQLVPLARAMDLDSFFAQRGMPGARFNQCLSDLTAAQRIAENSSRATTQENVTGTPTFFINGEKTDTGASWEALEQLLREEIG